MSGLRRHTFSTRIKRLVVSLTAIAAAGCTAPAVTTQEEPSGQNVTSGVQVGHPDADCDDVRVPVSVAQIGDAHVYGELCRPRQGGTSGIVQLLVPGSSYNHSYFDMPVEPSRYSYVAAALGAGFSTFNIDRLATGESTLPPSSLHTLDAGVQAIHQVIADLRAGEIEDRRFTEVVWVGHSLGSSMACVGAEEYDDVDAFVLTGMSHVVREEPPPSADPGEDVQFEITAMDDPKFRGTVSDPGYVTTSAGVRRFFYYEQNADPAVIEADERLKDLSTAADSDGPDLPPAQSPSRSIKVPTLLVVGDRDQYCTTGVCTSASMLAHERPYYSDEAELEAIVVPDSGHSVQLHRNAPETNAAILRWVATAVS